MMKFDVTTVETEINGKTITIETGKIAKQANGSVVVRCGDTMVLVTATASKTAEPGRDFFPLMIDYREKFYAAGKIPGGFFKREGRPGEEQILTCRLIDRPLRPLFPKGYYNEVIVNVEVISFDGENEADMLGMVGASAALMISDIPFSAPIAGVRICRIDGEFVINPSVEQIETSDMEAVVAGSEDSIVMVEGGANEISEDDIIEGINQAHVAIKSLVKLQNELKEKCGKEKQSFEAAPDKTDLINKITEQVKDKVSNEINRIKDKTVREGVIDTLISEVKENLAEEFPDDLKLVGQVIDDLEKVDMRTKILDEGKRIDGRSTEEIRDIICESKILPRAHGSALFTRGQTQAMVSVTLGGKKDERRVDSLKGDGFKAYMLHYNFPPYSVGEARPIRAAGRREIGHGHLAERSLMPVLPSYKDFAYTIRIVSDITESNGSSSMASVCGGSLSLLDAGVPIKTPVAGIAMGLIYESEDRVAILSDITGTEDHLGDMDFKVAGTKDGVTAFQMDIKIEGISADLMRKALFQAKAGREHILGIMNESLDTPNELSEFAPRIFSIKIPVAKIGAIIGPKGKTIQDIQEKTGTDVNIEDDGLVTIFSTSGPGGEKAYAMIEGLIQEPEIGKNYQALVKNVKDFGAFVEFMPGKEGLVHISEFSEERIQNLDGVVEIGDTIEVQLKTIDQRSGKISLVRKSAGLL